MADLQSGSTPSFLLKNRFDLVERPRKLYVTINHSIKLVCSGSGEFHWNAHPINFIENSDVVLDVFVNGKKVNETKAFEALCKVYDYPPHTVLRDVFCNNLLGNRIRRSSQPMAFELANKLNMQVTCEKDEINVETQNGAVLSARRSDSFFFYNLARLTRSEAPDLENAALNCIEQALTCGRRGGTIKKVTKVDYSELQSLAKAIAYAEDLSLVVLIGHYNAPDLRER